MGKQHPPAAVMASGIYVNYITTDRSPLGNAGIGGNGFYNAVGSTLKTGISGTDGLCDISEYS